MEHFGPGDSFLPESDIDVHIHGVVELRIKVVVMCHLESGVSESDQTVVVVGGDDAEGIAQ